MSAYLIDVSACCEHDTNAALDDLFLKASQPPDDSIWEEHQSPYVRRIIEVFTKRGLDRLGALEVELVKWVKGKQRRGKKGARRPSTRLSVWGPAQMSAVADYLRSIPMDDLRLEDWLLLADYLAHKYLPHNDLEAEAEWMAYRSTLMGRVQYDAPDLDIRQADRILAALPATPEAAKAKFALPTYLLDLITYAQARCAEYVVSLSDATRHAMRKTIIEYQADKASHNKTGGQALEQRLHDQFSTLNRDWRRIAVTEAGENADQAFVASTPPGGQLRRLEQYHNACPWCRSIDQRVVTVVPVDKPNKNGDTEIWTGKTNIGRSAAPNKRTPAGLVPRNPDELWWIAAGTQHPHCRGTWATVDKPPSAGDEEFTKWLWKTLEGVGNE